MSSVCIYNLYYLHQNSFDRHCDYHVVQPSFRMEAALADIHRGVCSCSQFSLPTVRVQGIKFRLSGLVDCKCFYPTKPLHTHLLFERIALLVITVPLVVWVHGASFLLLGLSSVDARSPTWWIRGLESLESSSPACVHPSSGMCSFPSLQNRPYHFSRSLFLFSLKLLG